MRIIISLLAVMAITGVAGSTQTTRDEHSATAAAPAADNVAGQKVRFQAFDVWVDSEDVQLAAYQVEVNYDPKTVKIVGVEGGEPIAFRSAPYYDEAGMQGGRIILAAFVPDDNAAPAGKIRVARLHLQITSDARPDCSIKLVTAAKPGGQRFKPVAQISELKISE